MTDRILGHITGTKKPWIAQSPAYRHPSQAKQLAHRIRAMHLKQNKLSAFRAVCVLESAEEFSVPKGSHIEAQRTIFGHCQQLTFSFSKIETKECIRKIRLIDDLGYLIAEQNVKVNDLTVTISL